MITFLTSNTVVLITFPPGEAEFEATKLNLKMARARFEMMNAMGDTEVMDDGGAVENGGEDKDKGKDKPSGEEASIAHADSAAAAGLAKDMAGMSVGGK